MINTLVTLQNARHMLPFKHCGKAYFLATPTGLEARQALASMLTADKISQLRSTKPDKDMAKMNILSEAGIVTCPSCDTSVFHSSKMPCLPENLRTIITAINHPAEASLWAAGNACVNLKKKFEGMMTEMKAAKNARGRR